MKSESYILLVVNPISGDCEKEEIIFLVEKEAAARNYAFKLYKTTGKNDKESLKEIIREKKPKRVLVAGGDGTISMVASCVMDKEIILAIIPAGSANGMAVNFELPDTLPEQVALAFSDTFLKIDTLFLNDQICLHIADLGINAELVKNYEGSNIRGKFGYFLQSIPTLFNSDSPFDFKIETSQGTFEKSGILLAIANANKFGTGATINPNGKINDGLFEVLVFKNLDFIEIFKTLQNQAEMSSDFVEVIVTDKAVISTKKNVPFQIDGEFKGEISEITATIKKQNLLMAVPEIFCERHPNLKKSV